MGYKYKVNHDYFEKIDSELKAYILGLIYADGSIIKPKNRQMKMVIALQNDDREILEEFSKEIGVPIRFSNPPAIQRKGWKSRCVIEIVSDKLCNDLISKGCTPYKSMVGMTWPPLDKSLIRHFIRGFLDGDGCITKKKVAYNYKRKTSTERKRKHIQRYQTRIAFTSSDGSFLLGIAHHLKLSKTYIKTVERRMDIHTLWIERVEDVKKTIEYLYENANYYLERKFNKTIKIRASGKSEEGLETRDTTVSP